MEAWLDLWLPELGRPGTTVVLSGAERLPMAAASRIRSRVQDDAKAWGSLTLVAERLADVPDPLADLVQSIVHVPSLRDRPGDVLPLARHLARSERGREVTFTAAAKRALDNCRWPGNVAQLLEAVRYAVSLTDTVDVRHLPAEVFAAGTRRLTRIEAFEREEIVRALTRANSTMREVAEDLGMSRATLYRKVAQYGLSVDRG